MGSDPEAARRCARCARALPEQARFCGGCGAAAEASTGRVCRSCGTSLGAETRFCPQCGRRAAPAWDRTVQELGARLRAGAQEVNWPRLAIGLLPPLTLLLAGLVGYTLGQQRGSSA